MRGETMGDKPAARRLMSTGLKRFLAQCKARREHLRMHKQLRRVDFARWVEVKVREPIAPSGKYGSIFTEGKQP